MTSKLVVLDTDNDDDDVQIIEPDEQETKQKSRATSGSRRSKNSSEQDSFGRSPEKPKKRKQDYEVIAEDPKMEAEIDSIRFEAYN